MPRGMTSRTWIKLYVDGMINGTIMHQLDAEEKWVWVFLLLWAGRCNRDGELGDNDGRPYPDEYLANRANVPLEVFQQCIDKSLQEGRLSRNGSDCLIITNWGVYQSEYQRQKKYRQQGRPDGREKFLTEEAQYQSEASVMQRAWHKLHPGEDMSGEEVEALRAEARRIVRDRMARATDGVQQ